MARVVFVLRKKLFGFLPLCLKSESLLSLDFGGTLNSLAGTLVMVGGVREPCEKGSVFYLGTNSCFTPSLFIDAVYRPPSVSAAGLFFKRAGKGADVLLCFLSSVSLNALATVSHDLMLHNPLIPATMCLYWALIAGAGNHLEQTGNPWKQRVHVSFRFAVLK